MATEKSASTSIMNFGAPGWGMIAYCAAMFFFYVGMVNDGTNITGPAMAAHLGLGLPSILTCGTIAGILAVALFIGMGFVNTRIGPRFSSGLSLIVSGLSYIGLGQSPNLVFYTAMLAITAGFTMTACYIAGGTLVAHWFPKKKGMAMGWTTMGLHLGSALYVPLIAGLVGAWGLSRGVLPIGAAVVVLGILGLLFIRNEPFHRGRYPDNVGKDEFEREYFTADTESAGIQWSTGSLMATKEFWLAAVITGGLQLVTVSVMTQLVVRNMQLGFTQPQAISIMTALAIVGIPGGWFVGFMDQKLGSKRSILILAGWYIVGLGLNILETPWSVWISLFMMAMAIGGSANFMTSLPASIFGRHGFAKVNSTIFPVQGLITALGLVVSGASVAIFGSFRGAYGAYMCWLAVIIVITLLTNDRKYNRDFQAEAAAHSAPGARRSAKQVPPDSEPVA